MAALAVGVGTLMASPAAAGTFVYVGNAESNDVYVLRLDRTSGELTALEKVAIPGITKPGISTPMAVSPDRRILYVGTRGEPKIAAGFAIDPTTGTLKHIASGPLADSMAYIATDRTGRFLLGASYPGNTVTVNPIGPGGTVEPVQQVLPDHPKAHAIQVDASNRYVLVPTLGNDRVNQFAFDAASGRLSPTSAVPVQAKAGPRHFAFHPAGAQVYVLGELDAAVYVFDRDAARGTLTLAQRVLAVAADFVGNPAAADLHLTPDGRFLYASVRATSTLAGFRVDAASGRLTPIGIVPTEDRPRGFGIDPSGRYLLAVGQASHRLSSYAIDPASGALTRLKQYTVGRGPNWVELVEGGTP
jgi:6-phosphogluconolactonase